MDDFEEIVQIKSDDFTNIQSFKDNIAVISRINDILYVHTNIFEFKSEDNNVDPLNPSSHSPENDSAQIYDITKVTQKLDWDQIRQLKINVLNPNIDLIKDDLKNLDKEIDSISKDDNTKLFIEDASYGLKIRSKGDKLSIDQATFIKDLSWDVSIETKDIWRAYNVSPSVVNKIKRSSYFQLKQARVKKIVKHYGTQKAKLLNSIKDFMKMNWSTFTAKEVTKHVNLNLNSDYSIKTIRQFMKTDMNMSYKRVKSRPININLKKINNIRSLFAVKYLKEISTNTLMINVDESSLNRDIKSNYSWGFKWKPIEAKNVSFSGSISWILAILSNGTWIWFLSSNLINSDSFIWFIKIMENWLNHNNNFGYEQIHLLLDNCSVYKSYKTKSVLKKLSYKIYYIPAYSPDFTPIEMCFSLLKRSLSERNKKENVKLSFKHNFVKIHNSLSILTTRNTMKMFGRFIKNLKQYLIL